MDWEDGSAAKTAACCSSRVLEFDFQQPYMSAQMPVSLHSGDPIPSSWQALAHPFTVTHININRSNIISL